MKWAFYKFCYFYNIIICTAVTCFGLYHDLKRSRFDLFLFLIYSGLISGFIKNLLSHRMLVVFRNKDIISKTTVHIFYVLWLINIGYTIALSFIAWEALTLYTFTEKDFFNTLVLFSFIAMTITSTYTLILDIPAARKASKAPDLTEELLSEYDRDAV